MTDVEVAAFSKYTDRLVLGERNLGEAEVTLALLCEAIREYRLTLDYVADLVDEMLAHYRFPFGHGEFARWAEEKDLFIEQGNPE